MSLLRFKQISGSILTTASVSLNTITFTKGDGTTFSLLIDTGSGGGGSGSTSPGGSNTQIQYNNNGVFGGVSNLTWNGTTLSATGSFTGSFTGQLIGTASWAVSASNAISSSYALSSSYAANGGVTKIIAGTNISISPTSGLGDVTINSSGGGSTDITNLKSGSFGVTVDGQGSTITTGDAGYILIPYNCTMSGWYMFGDQVGSIGIDLRKDIYDTFPAVQGDSICNSFFPTMSSAQKSSGSVAGWTTATLNSGDIINFNVTSSSSVTRVNLIVNVIKS